MIQRAFAWLILLVSALLAIYALAVEQEEHRAEQRDQGARADVPDRGGHGQRTREQRPPVRVDRRRRLCAVGLDLVGAELERTGQRLVDDAVPLGQPE